MLHRGCAAIVSVALGFFAGVIAAHAEELAYPTKAITLVAPIAAGGPLDFNARLIAAALTDVLGKQVVVENRTGAGVAIGTATVARATPDGYTLLLADIATVVGPNLVANVSYDPLRDFVPIAQISRSFMFLTVTPSLPARSVAEFIAFAKQKPDGLQFGSPGLGTPPHLASLAFARAAGIKLTAVNYRGGGPALADLMSGQIPMMIMGESVTGPLIKADKLRALALTGTRRSAAFPEIPTFRESSLDLGGVDDGSWFGIATPKGTPAPVIAQLNVAMNQALKDPKVRARFEAAGFTVVGGSAEQFGALMRSQQKFWQDALKDANVQPN